MDVVQICCFRFQNHADLYFSFLLTIYALIFAIKPVFLQLWVYAIFEFLETIVMSVMSPGKSYTLQL